MYKMPGSTPSTTWYPCTLQGGFVYHNTQKGGKREILEERRLASYVADEDLVPDTVYGPLNPALSDSRIQSQEKSPEHSQ